MLGSVFKNFLGGDDSGDHWMETLQEEYSERSFMTTEDLDDSDDEEEVSSYFATKYAAQEEEEEEEEEEENDLQPPTLLSLPKSSSLDTEKEPKDRAPTTPENDTKDDKSSEAEEEPKREPRRVRSHSPKRTPKETACAIGGALGKLCTGAMSPLSSSSRSKTTKTDPAASPLAEPSLRASASRGRSTIKRRRRSLSAPSRPTTTRSKHRHGLSKSTNSKPRSNEEKPSFDWEAYRMGMEAALKVKDQQRTAREAREKVAQKQLQGWTAQIKKTYNSIPTRNKSPTPVRLANFNVKDFRLTRRARAVDDM